MIDVILLLKTGYSHHWKDRKMYLGTDRSGEEAVQDLHFPGLHPDAARWLTDHRSVKAIGIDTASIDFGQTQTYQSHVQLFKHDIPVFENVAQLHKIPASGSIVIALPMKIGGGSGAPLRLIALVSNQSTQD